MLTIGGGELRMLANEPDTLGHMLMALAFDGFLNDADGIDMPTREGWVRCDPGKTAKDVHGGAPMQGYTREGSGVIVTLAIVDGTVAMHAEGVDWAIQAENRYAGWTVGDARAWTPTGMVSTRYPNIVIDPPWEFAPQRESEETDEPRVFGPDGEMHIDRGRSLMADDDLVHDPDQFLPAWMKPGYDWERHVAADPSNSLSRIHMLAAPLGIDWSEVKGEERATHLMMNRIEEALGIETTPPAKHPDHRMVHRLTLGLRIAAAEAAIAARPA